MTANDGLDWYWAAISGKNPPITTEPQAGYFVVKQNGRMVPASIYWEGPKDENGNLCGDETLHAEIGGVPHDPDEAWLWCAKRVVSPEEYQFWLGQLFNEAST